MSREVMRHGKTPQMPRVRGRWKIGFERHAENQDTRHTPDTALQGVWSQVHAQEPEAERGGGTARSGQRASARQCGVNCRGQFNRDFRTGERRIRHGRTNG